jgi:hypothetical protein
MTVTIEEKIKQFRRYYFKLATYNADATRFAKSCGYKSVESIPRDDLPTFIDMFLEHRLARWTGPHLVKEK